LSYEDARISILANSGPGDYLTRAQPHLPFFVYGTLLPGQPNYELWTTDVVGLRPAELFDFRLYDLGPYPMLVPSAGGVARGLVVDLERASYREVVAALDYLEGVGVTPPGEPVYRRERRIARLANGHTVVAWVYLGDRTFVLGAPPLESDWKTYCRERGPGLEAWWEGVASITQRTRGMP